MDVVVVGSGAAGLVCALVAAVGGLRVLVVEKSEKVKKKRRAETALLMLGGCMPLCV
jgi:flavin-dependent dehydrogenase